jgi:4-hydroxy-tetrahydrodipicolinate synthase
MIKGSIIPLITPFRDGAVDEKAFRSLIDWLIDQGSHGLVPCGTTGESATLTHDEHKRVTEICIEQAAKRVPVYAGAGSNATHEAIDFSLHAQEAGADGLLIVAPYYNKPTQEGLFQHFKAINDAVDIPILVYNIPGRVVVDIQVPTMARIAELKNIEGVKDSTGDVARISDQRLACGKDFVLLCGDDALALGMGAHGAVGCVSVTANIAPKLCAEFQTALAKSDFGKALELHDKLMPLHRNLFIEASPGPVKYAASLMGLCSEEMRLPMVPVSAASRERIKAAMIQVGIYSER